MFFACWAPCNALYLAATADAVCAVVAVSTSDGHDVMLPLSNLTTHSDAPLAVSLLHDVSDSAVDSVVEDTVGKSQPSHRHSHSATSVSDGKSSLSKPFGAVFALNSTLSLAFQTVTQALLYNVYNITVASSFRYLTVCFIVITVCFVAGHVWAQRKAA